MSSSNDNLANKPLVVIISLIASIIAIIAFLSGKQSIKEFLSPSQNQNPSSAPNPSVGQTNVECIHPQVLAQQKGWTDKGATSDIYGGWYVELINPDQLPNMWEALGEKHISQTDSDRTLTPGRWAIYTPFACRDQFGFSH